MSAGNEVHLHEVAEGIEVVSSLDGLAPAMRRAVEASLQDCQDYGYDAEVFESLRSEALQEIYYKRGRPPTNEYPSPVTNAATADKSWHKWGLAVDVISASDRWNAPEAWWRAVAEIFQANGCKSGYYWPRKDKPHHQWGKCRVTPTYRTIQAYEAGGLEEVWRVCDAL